MLIILLVLFSVTIIAALFNLMDSPFKQLVTLFGTLMELHKLCSVPIFYYFLENF